MQQDLTSIHRLGVAAAAAKNHEQALEHFRTLLELAPGNPSYHLDLAGQLRSLGRLDEAEAAAKQALALNPELGDAYRALGFVERLRKNHLAAIVHFEDAKARSVDVAWNTFEIAQEYRFLARNDEALRHYRAVLDTRPDFVEAYRSMGFIEAERRNHQQALEYFRAASGLAPSNPLFHVDVSGQLRNLARLDEAEAEARQALALNPDLPEAHRALGFVERARKNHLAAVTHFEDAKKRATDNFWNTFEIAQEYRFLGRIDDALAHYRAVLEAKPDFVEAYRSIGFIEHERKNHERALEHFRAARDLVPSNPLYHVDVAGQLRSLARLDEAEAEARKALDLNKDLPEAYRTLGFIERERKNHMAAIGHFEEAKKRAADNFWNTFEIAQEYRFMGRIDDALALYRAVIAIKPDFLEVYRSMGFMEAERKNHEQALAHFCAARDLAPSNPLYHVDVAGQLRSLGRLDESEAAARQALALNAEFSEAYRTLGFVERSRKNHLAAIGYFEEAKKRAAGNVWNLFEIAQEYRLLGRYDEALVHYRALLDAKPDFAEAYRSMGFMEAERKNHEQALEYFRAARDLAPANAWFLVDIAGQLRNLRRLDESEAAARQALDLNAEFPDAHRALGFAARERRDHLAAIAHFEQARKWASDNIWNMFDIAQEYRLMGRYDEAVGHYRAVLDLKPDFVEAYRTMGFMEMARGEAMAAKSHFMDALACLEVAEAANPGQFLFQIVGILVQLGRTTEATERLATVLPGSGTVADTIELYRLRAAIARKTMDVDGELAALRASLELRRTQRDAWTALVDRLVGTGHLAEATKTIEEAEQEFPGDPDLALERARIFRMRGQLDHCARELEKVSSSDDLSTQLLIRLADSLRASLMMPEARDVARRAVESDPGNTYARLSLALAIAEIDGPAAGVAELRDAIAAGQQSQEIVYHAARLLRETGNFVAALQFLEENTSTWRASILLFQEIILNLIETGDLKKGRELLELRREIDPDDKDNLCAEIDLGLASGNIKKIEELFSSISQQPLDHLGIGARVIRLATASHDFEVVIAAHERMIALDPTREIMGKIAMTEAQFNLGRRDRAYRILDDLAAKYGPIPEVYSRRGYLLRFGGNIRASHDVLEEGVRRNPHNFSLWAQFVRSKILNGSHEEAQIMIENCAEPARAWQEQKALLDIELCLERRDLDGCRERLRNFIPPYVRGRAHYHYLASRAALASLDLDTARQHLSSEISVNLIDKRMRRQSSNVSQSLMGQLLDDYRLDTDVVASLTQINTLPQGERLEHFLDIAGKNPESTSAAMTTLIHMRGQKLFPRASGTHGTIIPKRIAQFWDDPDVPADISAYMETWRSHNPDWSYELFDNSRAMDFIASNCTPDVLRAFRRADEPAMKADLFRLVWLNEGGGVYADADDACQAPLADVLTLDLTFFAHQEDIGSVGNNLVGATKGHPVISWALEQATDAIGRGDSDMVWLSTGPGLLSRSFIRWLALASNRQDILRQSLVLDRGELTRVCAAHCHATYKYTPKHWAKNLFG